MSGAVPPLPNTTFWRDAHLKTAVAVFYEFQMCELFRERFIIRLEYLCSEVCSEQLFQTFSCEGNKESPFCCRTYTPNTSNVTN